MRVFAVLVLLASVVAAAPRSPESQSQAGYDIAFVAKRDSGEGIFVMNGDGSAPVLVRAESNALLIPSSWSPDGKRIAYSSFGPEDEELLKKFMAPMHLPLYVMNADGTGRERLLDVPIEMSFRWSPDGRRLVFSSGFEDPARDNPRVQRGLEAGSVAVYTADLLSRKPTRLTPLGENRFASWSPDGLHIVFSGNIEDPNRDIYVVDADGRNMRRLTTAPTIDVRPQWSPRSGQIAWVAAPRPAQREIEGGVFVMKPDGSGVRQVSTTIGNQVDWSPDGAFVLIGSSSKLLVNIRTGEAPEVLPRGALDAAFAPDGKAILYRLREAGSTLTSGLFSVDLQGQNVQKLASSIGSFSVGPLRK